MQIYLEGNELNFKTTIAQKLSERLGMEYVKGSSFEIATATNHDMFSHFITVLSMNNVIVDRFIYSNYVYARLYPKYTILTPEQFQAIDFLIKNGHKKRLVIYLYADNETLVSRMKARGDEYITEDRLEPINTMYEQAWSDSKVTPLRINTAFTTSDEIVEYILQVLPFLDEKL